MAGGAWCSGASGEMGSAILAPEGMERSAGRMSMREGVRLRLLLSKEIRAGMWEGKEGLIAMADEERRWAVKMSWPIDDLRRSGCGRGSMLLSSKVMSSILASSCVSFWVPFEPSKVLRLWKLISCLAYERNSKPTCV